MKNCLLGMLLVVFVALTWVIGYYAGYWYEKSREWQEKLEEMERESEERLKQSWEELAEPFRGKKKK